MYICIINSGNKQRYLYNKKYEWEDRTYVLSNGYSLQALKRMVNGHEDYKEYVFTLEEAQKLAKRYNRYRKRGKFYDYGPVFINRLSKAEKLNKEKLKRTT